MVPLSLSIWTQRLGWAGRSGEPAIAILLVEPAVFRLQHPRTKKSGGNRLEDRELEPEDDEDEEPTEADTPHVAGADLRYQKMVEAGMRLWIEAPDCRRKVANEYFKNPCTMTRKSNSYASMN
jgi:superfamily II DNA helicase RecQ